MTLSTNNGQSDKPAFDVRALEMLVDRVPYHRWLGLAVTAVGAGTVEMSCKWRAEMGGSADAAGAHAGIIATLVDCGGGYALACAYGNTFPTITLTTDVMSSAFTGLVVVKASVVAAGAETGTAETRILDETGKLLARGRGVYAMAQGLRRSSGA